MSREIENDLMDSIDALKAQVTQLQRANTEEVERRRVIKTEAERLRTTLTSVAGDGVNVRYSGCDHYDACWVISDEQKQQAKEALD